MIRRPQVGDGWTRRSRCAVRTVLAAVLLLAAGAPQPARADSEPVAAGTVKMAIVYNLGKFVEWPAAALSASSKDFTLCVLGPVADLKQGLAAIDSKPLQGRELRIRRLAADAPFTGCQILYLSEPDEGRLHAVLASAHALNILTVSDAGQFTEAGGIVGLETQDSKIRFSINLAPARAANLHISSELLRLARIVTGAERN